VSAAYNRVRRIDLGAPLGPLSAATVCNGPLVHVSGQSALVDGRPAFSTIAEETRLTLEALERVLEAAGSTRTYVLRCGVYLNDLAHYDEMNAAYAAFFGAHRPARTTFQVAALPFGLRVEIDCVAMIAPA
jgi:2-iminobutanoate/2-iminopropanoate deaminase